MAYQISDINKYTQYWKDKFPNTYGDKTDEQIIEEESKEQVTDAESLKPKKQIQYYYIGYR